MATQRVAIDNSFKKYLMFIGALLVGLVAMLFIYFLLTKPPVAKTAQTPTDIKPLFSIYGFEGDLLRRPSSVALGADGNIYVADTGKQRIAVFDSNGTYVAQWSDYGTGKFQWKDPIGIVTAPDGRIAVLSKGSRKIVIYDSQHKPLHEIKFSEFPLSMTIHNNKLYVTTFSGIMVGDLDGNLVTTFGTRGKAAGQFDLPGGIVVGPDDTMYIADSLNYRVQALSKDGKPLWQYGKPLPASSGVMYQGKDRKFGMPASITMDDSGHLYVVDGLSSEIDILNTKGEYIDKIGDLGHDDGFFYYPEGISYAGGGKMVLADKFNDRVQVFQVPLATPATAAVFNWLPYLLLLLVPLAYILLRRSQLQIIASEDFLRTALANNRDDELTRAFKKLIVVPETFERLKDGVPEKLGLIQKPVSDDAVAHIVPASDLLTHDDLAALALALTTKGKRVLLTGTRDALKSEAERRNIATMSYAEFEESYLGNQATAKVEGE